MTAARRKITKAEKQSASPARGRRGIKAKPVMPQTASSKTEEQMAARLATLEPGSKRFVVLDAAIRFKRSWVELAQYLTRVREEGLFKEWGYRSFEAYAQHELHLKKETAQKLVRSYDFLNAHERPQLEAVVRASVTKTRRAAWRSAKRSNWSRISSLPRKPRSGAATRKAVPAAAAHGAPAHSSVAMTRRATRRGMAIS